MDGNGAGMRVGGHTILLLEDDASLRTLLGDYLGMRGYRILPARDAREAEAMAAEQAGPIHLFLADLGLDLVCGGLDVARRLRAVRPGLRVLYMSGGDGDAEVEGEVRAGAAEFLAKPFPVKVLADKVARMLGQDAGGGPPPVAWNPDPTGRAALGIAAR